MGSTSDQQPENTWQPSSTDAGGLAGGAEAGAERGDEAGIAATPEALAAAVADSLRRWSTGDQDPAIVGSRFGVERGRLAGLDGVVPEEEAIDGAIGIVEKARFAAQDRRPLTEEQAALLGEWSALALFAGVSRDRVADIVGDVCGRWG